MAKLLTQTKDFHLNYHKHLNQTCSALDLWQELTISEASSRQACGLHHPKQNLAISSSAIVLKLQRNIKLILLTLDELNRGLEIIFALARDPHTFTLDCNRYLFELIAHHLA